MRFNLNLKSKPLVESEEAGDIRADIKKFMYVPPSPPKYREFLDRVSLETVKDWAEKYKPRCWCGKCEKMWKAYTDPTDEIKRRFDSDED